MSRSTKRSELCLTTLAAAVAAASSPATADTFTVENKNASGPGSFLAAIQDANSEGGTDTIEFAISGTLNLTYALPEISQSLVIDGPGSGSLTIDADDLSSESPLLRKSSGSLSVSGLRFANTRYGAFQVTGEGTLELDDVRISGVSAVEPLVYAGAASTTVSISNSVFTNNDMIDDESVIHVTSEANLTITDSTISGNTVADASPALRVDDSTAYLNRVAIENNTNTGYGESGSGAVHFFDSSVQIVDSQLNGNRADQQSGNDGAGGGAVLADDGSLTITRSTLSGNRSETGGAIKLANEGSLEVSDSVFKDNETRGSGYSDGGAIVVRGEAAVSISNSTFRDNFAYDDGGAISGSEFSLDITSSLFENNRALDDGGAIRLSGPLSITDSSFIGNKADDSGKPDDEGSNRGGAIYKLGSEATSVSDSVFRKNQSATDGGAISGRGNDLTIENTLFDDNAADEEGGALSIRGYSYGTVELTAVTVSGNKADSGAAITANLRNGQDILINQSTISDNSASDGPALDFNVDRYSDVQISRSTLSGNSAGGQASAIDINIDESSEYGGTSDYSFFSINNSTISGNRGSNAAAAISIGNIEGGFIYSSTFVDNRGSGDGSVQLHLAGAEPYEGGNTTNESPNFTIANSILSSSNGAEVFTGADFLDTDGSYYSAPGSLQPTLTIADSNLEQGFSTSEAASTSPASVSSEDPELGPLQNNGGPTLTHAPLSALSPGVDAGEGGRPDGEDQRGVPDQGTTDQGAVEYTMNRPPRLDGNLLSELDGKLDKDIDTVVVTDFFVDDDGDMVSVVSVDGLPPGLTFTPGPDTISGTLEAEGEYLVTVTVTDDGAPALETTVQGIVDVSSGSPVFVDTGSSSGGSLGGGLLGLLGLAGWRRLRRR